MMDEHLLGRNQRCLARVEPIEDRRRGRHQSIPHEVPADLAPVMGAFFAQVADMMRNREG